MIRLRKEEAKPPEARGEQGAAFRQRGGEQLTGYALEQFPPLLGVEAQQFVTTNPQSGSYQRIPGLFDLRGAGVFHDKLIIMHLIKKQFGPLHFADWLKSQPKLTWGAEFVTLHNTSSPTLAQRPHGFTAEHMDNLEDYYKGQGWSGAPHLFVDQESIWLFNDLQFPGVHSPSWNHSAIGVEMLGEYDVEPFHAGVRHNAAVAIAAIDLWMGWDSSSLRLHKEDPKTTHKECPGKNVIKADFVAAVHDWKVKLKERGES